MSDAGQGAAASSGPRRHTSGFDVVGQSSDPTPGDVDEMGRLEQRYREIADNAQTALDKVKQGGALDNGLGKAMDALNKQLKDLPGKLQKTVTSYTDAADVYKTYAPVLRQTQDMLDTAMDQALSVASAANQTVAALPANPTDDQKQQHQRQQDAVSQAQGTLDSAKQMAAQAKEQHDSAASTFAHRLDVAASEAIPSRNIFQKIADFFANSPLAKLILTGLAALVGFLIPPLGAVLGGVIGVGLVASDLAEGKGLGDVLLDAFGAIPGVGFLGAGAKAVGEAAEVGGTIGKLAAGATKVAGKLSSIGESAGKLKGVGSVINSTPVKVAGSAITHGVTESGKEAAKEGIDGQPLDPGKIVGAGIGGVIGGAGGGLGAAGKFGSTVGKQAAGAGATQAAAGVAETASGEAIDGQPLDAGAIIGAGATGGLIGAGGAALKGKFGGGNAEGGSSIPTKTSRAPDGAKKAAPPVPPKPAGIQVTPGGGGTPAPAKKAAPPPPPPPAQSAAPAAAPPPPVAAPSGAGGAAAAVGGAGALGALGRKTAAGRPPKPPTPGPGNPVQAQGEIPGTKGVAHVPVPTDQRLPSPQSDKVAPLTGLNVNGVDHTPVIRQTNEPLFRNDSRDPSVIFQNGFQPKNTQSSPLHPFIDKNASSGFVSTTNQPRIPNDQKFGGFKFHIHAPGGIDAGKTFGTNLPHLDKGESEITFPGGIRTQNIAGAQPLNRDGTLGGFMPNPHFKPQAPNPLDLTPKPFQPPGPGAGGATGVPTHVTT